MTDSDDALLPLEAVRPAEKAKTLGAPVAAADLPVARVVVDNPLPHLDRPFDYLVPERMDAEARPGVRVRVRFAGKLVDGFLLERVAGSDHGGRLAALERVVSPEPVLTPEIAGLTRAVADRYAGTMADVLRLAVPPRHARAESDKSTPGETEPGSTDTGSTDTGRTDTGRTEPGQTAPGSTAPGGTEQGGAEADEGRPGRTGEGSGAWEAYPMGPSFLEALRDGRHPRAVWSALPGNTGWAVPVAEAVRATLEGGRAAVVVVPDGKDVVMVDEALTGALGEGRHVAITADLGPAERYRRWLRALRGQVRAVVGTRAAMFAPVEKLGLVVIWDDGDDLHAERLSPYPHAREVLALRAHRAGAGMLIGGYSRTAEATQLLASGWAGPIVADRATVRAVAPRVKPAGEDGELAKDQAARAARLPSVAWRALRLGLEDGPVLVQVPRRGYLPSLACRTCRAPARCAHPPTRATLTEQLLCHGPLALRGGHAAPYCRWCGRIAGDWRCPSCGDGRIRASVVGARRTAEELGRAFPSVPVKTSGREGVLATVGEGRALVVATPGAEPVAAGGYTAAVLLDGWAMLGRADLRAGEEAVRRWMNAAALLRPSAELVVLADAAMPAVQALLRWDPITHAERELADRRELGFPPAVRMATLTGSPSAVREMLGEVRLPAEAQVLGPVPVETRRSDGEQERAMIRVPRSVGPELALALKGATGVRAARKAQDVVRVSVDPLDLI
ncbi:primosomal protein N' [Nonomuraea dietziae]|uniref:primosomal protein N' n=1 Tax=Nonomuraea dietziae TaxID=65515 RepID=UPI0033FD1677